MAVLANRRRQPQAIGADNIRAAPATGSNAHQPGNALFESRTPAVIAISTIPAAARKLLAAGVWRSWLQLQASAAPASNSQARVNGR